MMRYCEKCQVLSKDGEKCPLCGNKALRSARADDPVLLFTTRQEEAERIAAAFDDEKIPHMERMLDGGGYTRIVLGRSRCASMEIFVPFGEIGRARDTMRGIGALKDGGGQGAAGRPTDCKPVGGKAGKEMSPGRRAAVRIFSAIAFLALVCAVVYLSDSLVAFLRSVFH